MSWFITYVIVFFLWLWWDCWNQKRKIQRILERYAPIIRENTLKEEIYDWLDAQ